MVTCSDLSSPWRPAVVPVPWYLGGVGSSLAAGVEGGAERHEGDPALGQRPARKDRRGGEAHSSLAQEQQEGPDRPWDRQTDGRLKNGRRGEAFRGHGEAGPRIACTALKWAWPGEPEPRPCTRTPAVLSWRPWDTEPQAGGQHVCLTPSPGFIPGASRA